MSKVRVYELAKELGLENKAVLGLCVDLGIEGKTSHSNSLSDSEADKIRRHVIRSAVEEKGDKVREVRRSGQVVTERRVGRSVIRRRKKSDAEEPEEEAEETEEAAADFAAPEVTLPSLAPNLAQERQQRNDALKAADALFVKAEQPAEVAPTEPVEPAKEDTAEETVEEEPVAQEVVDAEPEIPAEAKEEESVEQIASDPEDVDEGEPQLEEVRRRHDIRAPKVLGRIELPIRQESEERRPAEKRSEKKAAVVEDFEPVSSGKGKGKRRKDRGAEDGGRGKKPRKKQVLRKDELLDYDGEKDGWRGKRDKKTKRGRGEEGSSVAAESAPAKQGTKIVKIDGEISVGEFAKQIGVKAAEVVAKLMNLGVMATINQLIDFDTATLIAEEFGAKTVNTESDSEAFMLSLRNAEEDDSAERALRPPVVTVMGHVDHGKTSLLDTIRQTSVTTGEFGGITQHIGAYNVKLPSGGSVTFLDTPGHEAFTAMRARGAELTDIVVLVVAADDGVMPQTIEAISHSKAAGVPIIVAVNKMDVEGANPDKVINQLSEHGLVPEDWGGDTIICKVSAHTKEGIDELLENLHLQAEVLELKADSNRKAFGTVVESRLDKGRGTVITVLVQAGTLKKGDPFVAGAVFGKVKAMMADDGSEVEEAGPSIPVELLGASSAAEAGDDFAVLEDEARARKIAEERSQKKRRRELAAARPSATAGGALTLERFSEMVGESADIKELPLIIKADVQGSVEALADSLLTLSNDEVKVRIIHKAVGGVTENDVQLASASNAIIVGFNVRPDARASHLIESEGVSVLYSRVIYDLVESVESAVHGRMAPKFQEKTLGRVEVRQTFKVPKLGTIAGSYVTEGTIPRNGLVRLLRDGIVVYEGKLASLKRFKEDVREVKEGYECGIGLDGFSDIKDGDSLEVYVVEEIARQP